MTDFLIKTTQHEKKPHTEFINRFIKMNCAVDLMRMKMFPDAKEVTESLGAYVACNNLPTEIYDRTNDKVNCVVVGDGHRPRTGALIAHLTRWNVISVDPEIVQTVWPINRFKAYKNKIEDISLDFDGPTVIIQVHSHARPTYCLKSIHTTKDLWFINMPCCVKSDIDTIPHLSYRETRIWSPKNMIEVYKIQ